VGGFVIVDVYSRISQMLGAKISPSSTPFCHVSHIGQLVPLRIIFYDPPSVAVDPFFKRILLIRLGRSI